MSEQSTMKPRKVEAKLEEEALKIETKQELDAIQSEQETTSPPKQPLPLPKKTAK